MINTTVVIICLNSPSCRKSAREPYQSWASVLWMRCPGRGLARWIQPQGAAILNKNVFRTSANVISGYFYWVVVYKRCYFYLSFLCPTFKIRRSLLRSFFLKFESFISNIFSISGSLNLVRFPPWSNLRTPVSFWTASSHSFGNRGHGKNREELTNRCIYVGGPRESPKDYYFFFKWLLWITTITWSFLQKCF